MTESNDENKPASQNSGAVLFTGVLWWAMLLVGVIAIPAAAIIITLALPLGETGRLFSFIVACWFCTWVGMWLMTKAKQ